MRKVTALAALGSLLAATGCSNPPAPAPDDSPQNATAVFETHFSSTGLAGMFPFETTEKHYVRTDRRRDDASGKGTGAVSGLLLTHLMGEGETSIARLDRKVRWTINNGKHEYVECPLTGCPQPAREKGEKPAAQQEQPKQKTDPGCVMRLASSKFDVKHTGEKRTVNGFAAEQYAVTWLVKLQDQQKRTTTSTVKIDLWTTPLSGQVKQALDTEAAFERSYSAAVIRPQPIARIEHGAALPPNLVHSMTMYLAALSPADRAALQRAGHELAKIQGHPVLTKLDWLLDGDACGAKDGQGGGGTPPNAFLGLASSLNSAMGKNQSGPQPIMSLTQEVKQLGVVPAHDSLFSVPSGYKLANPH